MPSPFQLHVEQWKSCTKCELHKGRHHVVISRSTGLPCDILFVGQAPGKSENDCGIPFCGPAGHFFDEMLREAVPSGVTYALTNLVCCIARDEDGVVLDDPPDFAIKACAPRLSEFIELASPKIIVCVGKIAGEWLVEDGPIKLPPVPRIMIFHPGSMLPGRVKLVQSSLMRRKAIVGIQGAIQKYLVKQEPYQLPAPIPF